MKRIKKHRGIEQLKARYGMMFTTPWIIGIIIFFALPLVKSVIYSFSEVTITEKGVVTTLLGIDNYKQVLFSDVNFTKWLKSAVVSFAYSLPIIILISLVLALLLNQKFRGRLFFRALYFLPVIIATGGVIDLVFSLTASDMSEAGVSDSFSAGMFNVSDIISWLNLSGDISTYVKDIISRIFDLVWNCGIQTVLFLAGLQSVPSSLYEASKVEGATKWEEFWFITFPMLSRVTLLVTVFTMVELIISEKTDMVDGIYGQMRAGIYDVTSAMLWLYFLVFGAIMGVIVLLYTRLLMKRWE
jgi:ABC-type sugar transport system permease subunit